MKENKIHIAYGFHVNCYHSYRGDTNDNLGFGSDIRIIRKILDTLTEFNNEGIPVKGTWDTENFFSLQKILPEYAPDIIEKMKERVEKYGDENIIMGYNNGALAAMNDEEFEESIRLAVTNKNGSGLKDIFGKCEMIVRPQEVMFTPSQVSLYNKLGIKAVCLYYSCVPFDAFRTIVPKLSDEEAFNPLTYTYKGESITVIPTYSNPDVCDAGCLRAWVKELRAKQEKGEINRDLFIFINMDADAIFWETIDMGAFTGKIANTDGIHGLVKEVADLPYVVFDTPGGYLKNHPPVGKIDFTHDTADGNFTGYASWAEKPFNRKIWTRIERARMLAKVTAEEDRLSPSFDSRILLLSTTHFGLATPVLNIRREKTALELSEKMMQSELFALPVNEETTVYNTSSSRLQCIQLRIKRKIEDISCIKVSSPLLDSFVAIPTADDFSSAFIMMYFSEVCPEYKINISFGEAEEKKVFGNLIKNDRVSVMFSPEGEIKYASFDGRRLGHEGFLESYITYDGKKYYFENKKAESLPVSGDGEGIRIQGEIHLPGELRSGSFTYDFFKTGFSDAVYVRMTVSYPYTEEKFSVSTENSALGRFTDVKWTEAVPFQLTPEFSGDISVIKRNFSDDISSYRTQSFPECDSLNKNVDSFNHHLTNGLTGLFDEKGGIILANARQVLSSMAHCPMRLEKDKIVRMNPFGTYFGKQRHHWSRTNGQILDVYTLVASQGKSIAPAYNGSSETAVLGLYPLNENFLSDKEREELCAFCDGAVAVIPENPDFEVFTEDNISVREGNEDGIKEKDLKNPVMTGISGNLFNYITKGSRAIFHIIKTQIKTK